MDIKFLNLRKKVAVVPEVQAFGLEEANEALILLNKGKFRGAGILSIREWGMAVPLPNGTVKDKYV